MDGDEESCLLQAWLFAGNSSEDQLGDVWALDLEASRWRRLADNPDQAKAWHQASITISSQVFRQPWSSFGNGSSKSREESPLNRRRTKKHPFGGERQCLDHGGGRAASHFSLGFPGRHRFRWIVSHALQELLSLDGGAGQDLVCDGRREGGPYSRLQGWRGGRGGGLPVGGLSI